jgi:arylsulfatase A-like enzyme
MDPRDLAHVIARYDGEIRYTDEHLGTIIEELRRLGALDDTITAVTADHGEEFFEHDRKGHGLSLYDEVVQIPLVVRYPRRIPAGQRVSSPVRLMDVAPTVLALAGVDAPAEFGIPERHPQRGRNLAPWIARPRSREAFPALLAFSETSQGRDTLRSVRSRDGKYILSKLRPRKAEAYRLLRDPEERRNVLAKEGGLRPPFRHLDWALRSWAKRFQGREMSRDLRIDAPQKERLRALGYIE